MLGNVRLKFLRQDNRLLIFLVVLFTTLQSQYIDGLADFFNVVIKDFADVDDHSNRLFLLGEQSEAFD